MQVPKGLYRGDPPIPARTQPTAGIQAMLLTHAQADQRAISAVTASLYERRNELVALTARAATIAPPQFREGLGLPLHPAAQAYYTQDKPSFLEQYAEVMGFLLSVSLLTISTLFNLQSRFQNRQKNRGDAYNLEVLNLVLQMHQLQDLQELAQIRQKLFEIFQAVLTDLDRDQISAETFQAFAIPWKVAIDSLYHHERLLQERLSQTISNSLIQPIESRKDDRP
jgi:uncharacterized protein